MNTLPGVSGKEMGQKLKAFRLGRGWTQMQAAVHLGISLRTLIALETNFKRRFRPLTLAKINMAMESIQKAA